MKEHKEMTAQQAYLKLAELCAKGEHCQQELLVKMQRWGLSDEAQASVMERLVGERYVDDERFCRAFVHDKIHYDKWGRRKAEQALWQGGPAGWEKNIREGVRRRGVDEVPDAGYLSILRPLLAQKRRTTRAASDYELRQKLMKWALGRGFGFDIIRQCMEVDDEEEFSDADF